jgi:formate dehydrogenase gamma subunit
VENRTIRRFRKRTIVLHWIHSGAFALLALTGAAMFFHGGGYGGGNILKIIHRAMAILFIAIPLVNYFIDPKTTINFVKETFMWSRDDIKWALAAPGYYFGGPEEWMPPQGHLNAGQKLWQAIIIVTGVVFVVTGIILLVFKWSITISTFEWVLFAHGIAFVIVFLMFMLHTYLAVFHPRFKESFKSMIDGKISPTYARTHYAKWWKGL